MFLQDRPSIRVKQDETTPAWTILGLVAQPVIPHTLVERAFSPKYRHDLANGPTMANQTLLQTTLAFHTLKNQSNLEFCGLLGQ